MTNSLAGKSSNPSNPSDIPSSRKKESSTKEIVSSIKDKETTGKILNVHWKKFFFVLAWLCVSVICNFFPIILNHDITGRLVDLG